MRARHIIGMVACAIAVAATALQSVPTSPASASAHDLTSVQNQHLAVIAELSNWDALHGSASLGTIEGDPAAGTIDVGWVGDVPAEVQAIADAAAAAGVAVTFVPQAASAEALLDAAREVAESLPGDVPVTIAIDGASLSVEVPTEDAAEEAGVDTVDPDTAQRVADEVIEAADLSGVDIETDAVEAVPTQTARSGDRNDLRGGSRYNTQFLDGRYLNCTSGFQAVYGHFQYFVTAAHCSDYADDRTVQTTSGVRLGVSDGVAELNDGPTAYDLGLVRLNFDIFNRAEIYTSDTSTLQVSGWMSGGIPSGYALCGSGSVSGNACNLVSGGRALACYATGRSTTECVEVVRVTATTGTAFCLGDSGGPVYGAAAGNTVTAAGVVSGVRLLAAGDRCSPNGYVAPIADLFRTIHGLQLRTVTVQ